MKHDKNQRTIQRTDEALREKWTSAKALEGHPDLFDPSAVQSSAARPPRAADGATPMGSTEVAGCPPWVLRGAKSQVAVGIDWMTITGPKAGLEEVTTKLEAIFGLWVTKGGKGFQHGGSRAFANGAMIAYDDPDKERPIIRVEIGGNALAGLLGDDAVNLLKSLMVGRKCTRIDVRLDWQSPDGERVGVIDLATGSCRRDELCWARRWKPHEDMDGIDRVGHGLYIGRRGKDGSGRFLRIYDKGLETGERPVGTWERYEVEHTGDVANDVAVQIASSERWVYTAMSIALGAVDFHENNGSRELDRRPRVSWWSQVLDGIEPVNVRVQRSVTSLERWNAWASKAIVPTMKAAAAHTGQSVAQMMTDQFAHVLPHRDGERHPVVFDYKRHRAESCSAVKESA